MKIKDVYIGTKLNKLKVIDISNKEFICKCFCGAVKKIDKSNFIKGKIQSCGCLKRLDRINKRIEYIGKKFGMLQVIDFYEIRNSDIHYKCLCDCGNISIVNKHKLRCGKTVSCGCYKSLWCIENKTKHNGKKLHPREYSIWRSMKSRCSEKDNINYGAKGIEVCNRWLNSFENFYADMGECPSNKHQIDRIDSNKGYYLENCRWVTPTINNVNKKKKDTWGIIENKNGTCFVSVSREYTLRRCKALSLDEAKKIRDLWVIEYDNNPNLWIENTKNNKYKEFLV